MRSLLILSVFLLLTQVASAERWKGLIASVAALEAARVAMPEVLILDSEYRAPMVDYMLPAEEPCVDGTCPISESSISEVGTQSATYSNPRRGRLRRFLSNIGS